MKCDCGALVAKTTHARWCSTHGKNPCTEIDPGDGFRQVTSDENGLRVPVYSEPNIMGWTADKMYRVLASTRWESLSVEQFVDFGRADRYWYIREKSPTAAVRYAMAIDGVSGSLVILRQVLAPTRTSFPMIHVIGGCPEPFENVIAFQLPS